MAGNGPCHSWVLATLRTLLKRVESLEASSPRPPLRRAISLSDALALAPQTSSPLPTLRVEAPEFVPATSKPIIITIEETPPTATTIPDPHYAGLPLPGRFDILPSVGSWLRPKPRRVPTPPITLDQCMDRVVERLMAEDFDGMTTVLHEHPQVRPKVEQVLDMFLRQLDQNVTALTRSMLETKRSMEVAKNLEDQKIQIDKLFEEAGAARRPKKKIADLMRQHEAIAAELIRAKQGARDLDAEKLSLRGLIQKQQLWSHMKSPMLAGDVEGVQLALANFPC
jgi:hypothetical protein